MAKHTEDQWRNKYHPINTPLTKTELEKVKSDNTVKIYKQGFYFLSKVVAAAVIITLALANDMKVPIHIVDKFFELETSIAKRLTPLQAAAFCIYSTIVVIILLGAIYIASSVVNKAIITKADNNVSMNKGGQK